MAAVPVAQGLKKQSVIVKQSGLGVPGSTGGQILRRTSSVFTAAKATFASNEIITHEQSTGVGYGMKSIAGTLAGELSPATYKLLMAASLRKDFAATAAMTIGTDCTSAATAPQFVDGSAGFLTAGLKVGDVGQFTGFSTTAVNNNGKNFLITALTAGNMTGVFLNGDAVLAKVESGSVVFTVVGKKTLAPLTGHTNDYFSYEEWYADLSKSEFFTDVKVGKLDLTLPATGIATVSTTFMGLQRTLGVSQVLTSPASETTTPILTAVQGALYVQGSAYAITGATISIDGTMTAAGAEVGTNIGSDISRGMIKVTGQITGLFKDTVIQALYDAETVSSLIMVVADNLTATSAFLAFTLGAIKFTGDAPDDGEKQITRTYPFTAQINTAGGPALAFDETIMTIQDSAA
jgi:hypothetical protein